MRPLTTTNWLSLPLNKHCAASGMVQKYVKGLLDYYRSRQEWATVGFLHCAKPHSLNHNRGLVNFSYKAGRLINQTQKRCWAPLAPIPWPYLPRTEALYLQYLKGIKRDQNEWKQPTFFHICSVELCFLNLCVSQMCVKMYFIRSNQILRQMLFPFRSHSRQNRQTLKWKPDL